MGKKAIKFLSITIGIIAVIIIGLTVFIKIYITPERVKALLVPQAEKSLNRKVAIGEVNIDLLKGISVTDFVIRETDGKTDFISCKDFVLKFKLLPLFSKKVVIDELRLVAPSVRIERDILGKFNFHDIGKKKPDQVKEETPPDAYAGLPISLLVSNVSVKDSRFSLIDLTRDIPDVKGSLSVDMTMKSSGGGELLSEGNIDLILDEVTSWKPQKKTIKNLRAGIRYIARMNPDTGEIDLENADLMVQDILASIKGKTKNLTTSPDIDISLSIQKTETADVLDLLSSFIDLKGLSLSGSFATDIKVKGQLEKIDSLKTDGSIDLENIGIKYDSINTTLGGAIVFNTSSDNLSIKKADLNVQGISASLNGDVKNLTTSPYLDVAVSVPRVKAAHLQQALAPFTDMIGIGVSGALKADLKIQGKPEALSTMKATGNVNFDKIGVTYQDVKAMLDGSVALKENLVNIDLKTTVGENSTTLTGSVKNLFKNQDININIYSKSLNIDKLIPPAEEKEEPASTTEGTASKKAPKEAEPLDLKFTARGEIKVDSAVYKGLNMKNLLMKYNFRNNKLTVSKLSGNAGKGTFDLISAADLSMRGYSYNLSGTVDSLYAEEIINAFFPKHKDTIYGVVSTNLTFSGKGTLPGSIKRNLAGNADFTIRDGKITNIPMLNNLAAILKTRELETINVKQGNGKINIANGLAQLDSIITSDDVEMDPKGDIELVDESLDLAFDLRLSPRLKGKAMSSGYSDYLSDEAGWGMIPVTCPGTFSQPRCGPDLAKTGKRAVEKEIDKQIDKIFKKKEGEESPETEAVKDLLKGIFGK
jgi:AsmA protein